MHRSRHVFTIALCTVAATLLVAREASAQSVTMAYTDATSAALSQADCTASTQATISLTWTVAFTSGDTERAFLSSDSTCPTDGSATLKTLVEPRARTQDTTAFDGTNPSLTPKSLFETITGEASCPANVDKFAYICVVVTTALGEVAKGSLAIEVDSTPTGAPTITSVSSYDSALDVNWTAPSDTVGFYRIYYKTGSGSESTLDVAASATSARIENLTNDVEYTVAMTAFDDTGSASRSTDGNESVRSATATGTPRASQDFLERYAAMGGSEQGGCASTTPGLWALPLLAVWLLRRRKVAGPMAAAIVVLATSTARADDPPPEIKGRGINLALRIGPYRPNVDSEPGLTGTPYKDIFGSGSNALWQLGVGFDVIRKPWGSVGVDVSVGTWGVEGKARFPQDNDKVANDAVYMKVFPVSTMLLYRADQLYNQWHLPVVPYVMGGYSFAHWSAGTDNGTSSATRADGASATGSGWARGLEAGGGVHVILNWFDPNQSKTLFQEAGIVRASVFAEYRRVFWRGATGLRLDGGIFSGGLSLGF